MLLRWLPAAALLAVPLEAALLNQIDPLPPQTSPLTFAQSLKEAQDTFAAADKFFAAARLEHARDRESVERMERAVAQHQAEIPGMEFAGMQDPLPLPQIPQRTLPSAFAQSRKVSEAEIPGMEFAGMQDPLPLPQMPQRTLPSAFAQSRKVLEETPRPELAGMQDPLFWRQTPQRTLPSAFAQSRKVLEEIPRPELAGMQDPLPLRQTPQRRLPSAFMQSRKVSEEIPRTELAGMQDPLPLRQTPQRRLPSAFTQSRKVSEEIPRTELAGMQDPLPLRQTQQRTSPLAFAQSRKAAEDAWAAADKLFAAARLENTRDSVERVEHAVARARRHQAEIPGAEFAGMQAPPAADMHPCKMDCSNQGLCLAGKCMCRDGFYGDLCEHPRCLNDFSGHGQCLTGQCKCSSNYGGEDCSQLIQTQSSLAFLRRGLAAESAELAKQSSQSPSAKVSQVVTKACPLNCNSRGDCRDGTCECHDGWTGSSCQDYLQPALVDLTEGQSTSSCANQCSGHGVCESNGCKCHEGYRGEACDEAFQLEQPLQLKLQQVSKEDEQHTVTCPGGCGHGICKVGICDCDAGWQGTSCSISDEAALQGLEEQAALSSVPAAASWIGTGHADEVGTRALRAAPNQVTVPKTQLSAIQGQTEQGQRASSSFGVQAASALNRWLKSAKKVSSERPVDQLASLLSSAVAPPTD